MYDQFVRNNTTNRLQADLRSTMKTYDYEKERLSYQLANLQTTDRSQTNASIASSMDLSSNTSVTLTPRKFYRAPNMAAQSSSGGFKKEYFGATDKKWKDRKDHADKFKKEKDLLKLPVIHSASSKRSEWESGKFLQMSNPKQGTFSGLEPLPGINAAKALLAESMKIPSIYDPQRTDHAFDTTKSKKAAKKVTFADENHGTLLSINQIETNASESFQQDSKNSEGKGPVPRLNLKANKFSHVARPIRPRKTSLLPPLQIIPTEMRQNPQKITDGVNQWKSIYSRIVDPEEKTRALADIFSALRLKKFENEQAIKYGDSPRPAGGDEIKDFLANNTLGRIAYKDEQGHVSRHSSNR